MSQSLLPCAARSSTMIGGSPQASCEHRQDHVVIHKLLKHDVILLEIFHFYVNDPSTGTDGWHTLVHVCQRWRHVVFASPRRLNLRIEYRGRRPMSELLDLWPLLPVVIRQDPFDYSANSWENLAAALESEHHHRICEIRLSDVPTSKWERLAAAIQKPFPELTFLQFWVQDSTATSLPDSFLGGSAPLLRYLSLDDCPCPEIPKLLLSSNQLVVLGLWNIPASGHFSPQDLGTALSVMSRLEYLRLGFPFPRYSARPPLPLTRSVLPALTKLSFYGIHEYLEDLLAQIEAPLLHSLDVVFGMDSDFVLPQLHRLINHAESFKTCDKASLRAFNREIEFAIFRCPNQFPKLSLRICYSSLLDRLLTSLAQIHSSFFPLLSTLVQLDIVDASRSRWTGDMEAQWLELLAPLTAVEDLFLSHQVAPHVFRALEELTGERGTEVLPALQNIFFKDLQPSVSVPKYVERFVAARKLSGHPVLIHQRD